MEVLLPNHSQLWIYGFDQHVMWEKVSLEWITIQKMLIKNLLICIEATFMPVSHMIPSQLHSCSSLYHLPWSTSFLVVSESMEGKIENPRVDTIYLCNNSFDPVILWNALSPVISHANALNWGVVSSSKYSSSVPDVNISHPMHSGVYVKHTLSATWAWDSWCLWWSSAICPELHQKCCIKQVTN